MSSKVDTREIAVQRAEAMGPDAKIDVYLMLKEVDIALTTRREPDCAVAFQAIKKFCTHYEIALTKGYNGNQRPAEQV